MTKYRKHWWQFWRRKRVYGIEEQCQHDWGRVEGSGTTSWQVCVKCGVKRYGAYKNAVEGS